MVTTIKKAKYENTITAIALLIFFVLTAWPSRCLAFPKHSRKEMVKGPWELAIQIGEKGAAYRFPVLIENPDKETPLNQVLPVMGTPVKITLERFLPNLTWDTIVSKRPGAGVAATLNIKGPNLDQKMWLASDDPERKALTSRIGGVTIKRLEQASTLLKLVHLDKEKKVIGVISVKSEGMDTPYEFLAEQAESIDIPGSNYKLKIMEYMPNYSIDMKTKKIFNQSDKPVNPAIHIQIDDGRKKTERWLWSNFGASPHSEEKLPLTITFTNFDLMGMNGNYIIACAPETDPWLFFFEQGETKARKIVLGQVIPFADERYSFTIENITDNAELKETWRNKSDSLLNPALIVSIEYDNQKHQAVLELDKPYHQKSDVGTMVLLYRQQPVSDKQSK